MTCNGLIRTAGHLYYFETGLRLQAHRNHQ